MKDYIYIIGGIAYVAYMIYSSMQKQKKQQEQARFKANAKAAEENEDLEERAIPVSNQSSVFDEILGLQNFNDQFEDELEQDYNYSEPLDSIPDEEGVPTTVQDKIRSNKNKDDLEKSKEVQKILLEDDYEEESEKYEFDLKNAIISAEILNPPYIKR